jgi:hypothetical protein
MTASFAARQVVSQFRRIGISFDGAVSFARRIGLRRNEMHIATPLAGR